MKQGELQHVCERVFLCVWTSTVMSWTFDLPREWQADIMWVWARLISSPLGTILHWLVVANKLVILEMNSGLFLQRCQQFCNIQFVRIAEKVLWEELQQFDDLKTFSFWKLAYILPWGSVPFFVCWVYLIASLS